MDQPLEQVQPEERQIVLGTFTEREQARAAIETLQAQGIPQDSISVVMRHDGTEVSAEEMAAIDQEADVTGTDVALGSTAGGLAGFVAGLALFSIPGLGPFLGIGVLATTLGGAALGSAAGQRTAHLSTLGIPEERAERYHGALESGEMIVAITTPDTATAMSAREALAANGAQEVDVHPFNMDTTSPAV